MKILWINDKASRIGGCESYIFNTAQLLNEKNHQSFLFYDVNQRVTAEANQIFRGVHPIVDIKKQVQAINPDIIYLHRLPSNLDPNQLLESRRWNWFPMK